MDRPRIVSRAQWLAARKELLLKEKAATRARDALSAERRALPMVEIERDYLFDGPHGRASLRELFEGHRQLIVYHFMFDPSWDEGCPSCSYFADNLTGAVTHLPARDTSLAVVSRAPRAKLAAFAQRMGWSFPWFSSFGNDFNYDFGVTLDAAEGSVDYNYESAAHLRKSGKIWIEEGELPGLSVFLRDGGRVFHTYSTHQRGLDLMLNTYNFLDLTPLGRNEDGEPYVMAWVRHHDNYPANRGRHANDRNEVSQPQRTGATA